MNPAKPSRTVKAGKARRSGLTGAQGSRISPKTKATKKPYGPYMQPPKGRGPWISFFFGPEGRVSIKRVAQEFGMSKGQLAETIGVRREAVYRKARAKTGKAQARTTEMLEIVARIAEWAGGEQQAMAWYRAEPIAAFGGRTAESLVKEGKAAAVRDYLDHVATGGFA